MNVLYSIICDDNIKRMFSFTVYINVNNLYYININYNTIIFERGY